MPVVQSALAALRERVFFDEPVRPVSGLLKRESIFMNGDDSAQASTLFARMKRRGKIPTPPGVVLRLLELTQRADATAREIADTVALDPGLAAKILRFVNSPLAGVPREISSLTQAVALLGMRAVRMMALSFSVLARNGREFCAGFDYQRFAMQSLGCGLSARALSCETERFAPQEAMVAGLLSQIGRSTLASGFPDDYAAVLEGAGRAPRDLPALELARFGGTYATVGGQLLRSWGLPEETCRAIEVFREVSGRWDGDPLPRILKVAELAAASLCPSHEGEPVDSREFVEAAGQDLGIRADRCGTLMGEIARELEDARAVFELPDKQMRTIEEIEEEVRERITELSMALHIENQNMAQQQEELVHRATTDALTGVGNRASFDARLSLELERSARFGTPVALLMIDVDHFKAFNDTNGHQAGDCVLRAVARVLDDNIRKVDYCARYGGEEFAVIAPSTPSAGVAELAERLRRSVEVMKVAWEGRTLKVTISVGAGRLHEVADVEQAARDLIRLADERLYEAKCAGRNRVVYDTVREAVIAAGQRTR